jgi:uncharacterized membrane protein
MSRRRSGSGSGVQIPNDEQEYASLPQITPRRSSKLTSKLKFLFPGLLFSALGILLYLSVGGVNFISDLPYLGVALVIGGFGLSVAYSNVAAWVRKQRSIQNIESGSEGLWFSLFYNNAFYIFLLFLGSHLVFSTLNPSTSLVLTQLFAVVVPAWMSTPSK